jgi:hypothetical protein
MHAVASVVLAVAAGAAPLLETLTLQSLGSEGQQQEEVWSALSAVLAAATHHQLRALTIFECRRGSKGVGGEGEEKEADARWQGLLGRLAAEAEAGEEGAMAVGVEPRAFLVKIIAQDRTYSMMMSVGAANGGGGGGGSGGRRRSSTTGRKS